MKKTTIISTLISLILSTQLTMASTTPESGAENDVKVEEKMSVSERISLKLEEKKRLRETAERRIYNNNDVASFYIEELKHDDKVKALLREASFYFDFMIENHDNYEAIKKESDNIGFNSICLASLMSETEFFITFESISSLKLESETDMKKFNLANELLMKAYQENPVRHTQEEIDIRCKQVYK